MRVRLLTTLVASAMLHFVLAGTLVLSLGRGGSIPGVSRGQASMTRLILVAPVEIPAPKPIPPLRSPQLSVVGKIAKPGPPESSRPSEPGASLKTPAIAAAKPVVESNPNAHLPAPAPEAILNPTPPPVLDASQGVVILLDVSGSMYEPYGGSTRLTLARQVASARIRALRDGTPFSLVVYAQTASASGPLVAASAATREAAIRYLLRDVDCGGGTNLPAGLIAARRLHTGDIVLLTDGDLNTTAQSLAQRAREILGDGAHGPALEVIGIAPRPSESADQLLQSLAAEQHGSYQDAETETAATLLSMRTVAPNP